MIEGHATARYVRTSAQKAKLVLDLIRGRDVNHAFATLRFARKHVARDIEKLLRSAVANAQQKEGASGDVDRLYVGGCHANQGPSLKRIRAAPMGRAFRILKRMSHLTVMVRERQEPGAALPTGDAEAEKRPVSAGARKQSSAAKAAGRRRGPAKKAKTKKAKTRKAAKTTRTATPRSKTAAKKTAGTARKTTSARAAAKKKTATKKKS